MVLIMRKDVYLLGHFFSTSGHILGPSLERSGIMGLKEKFFFSECVLIFGYPFESCTRGLDCKQRRVVLGSFFLNFGSYSRPKFERSGIMG
jgi:hypothetical protein